MAELPTNASGSMLSALPQLLQLFTGTGKQTGGSSTTTSTAKNANSTAVQALVELLGSNAANPNAAGGVVSKATQNAIQMMLQAGVPSIGAAERGSGIYNASATSQAMNNLEATTAAKAAELEVNQMNQAAQTRTAAATSLSDMTGTVTQTQAGSTNSKQAGSIDPMTGLLVLGGLMGANALFGGNKRGQNQDAVAGTTLSPDFTAPIATPDVGNILSSGIGSLFKDVAGGLKSATFDPVTGEQRTGGLSEFTDVLTQVGENNILGLVGKGVSDAGTGIWDAVSSAVDGLFGGSSSGSGKVSVICTRMHELGYLSHAAYFIDTTYGAWVTANYPKVLAWYHSWAIPFVANWLHGETLASKAVIQLVRPAVQVWSAYMMWQVNRLLKASASEVSRG